MSARVERFYCKTARSARHQAPWAQVVKRVGEVWVAYERAEDAEEEHGKMGNLREFHGPAGKKLELFNYRFNHGEAERYCRYCAKWKEDREFWKSLHWKCITCERASVKKRKEG